MENTNINTEDINNTENLEPADNAPAEETAREYEIVGVRFKEVGKIYYFDPVGIKLSVGDKVIVETSRGVEYGHVLVANKTVSESEVVLPLKKVLRRATRDDTLRVTENESLAEQAKVIFKEKCAAHKLDMNLVDAEMTFDNSKLLFNFTSDGRVDFREFVKDIASVFKMRIELRQIGVRDEAKQLGGLGICGREFCCHSFLSDFDQVSIKMAKEQGLSINSAKISGTCGRLMCCLRYESDTYEEEIKKTPRVGSIVTTPQGKGLVIDANPLAGIVKVSLDANKDAPPVQFIREQVKVIGGKKPPVQDETNGEDSVTE